MRQFNSKKISELQNNPSRIRNICIVAHVDHGKTTLADSLVASNGIISQKLVGKLRYMDSRKDEQERGITMKSSSISLSHTYNNEEFLVNLIDSPGHVDFSSEVSTAVRLCDGAIVVVDVVEGVCAQTKVVLKQVWLEHIQPVLVLNKIDRLVIEMKMQPLDAYIRMVQLLEQVNAQVAELFTIDVMSKKEKNTDSSSGLDEADDSNIYFTPEQGNVVFASAADGWGFSLQDFARMFSSKLGLREEELQRSLWGDYYFNTKTKAVTAGAQEKAKKPLFVQVVLENLWSVYDSVVIRKDKLMTEKIVQNLQLQINPRDLKHSDPKVQIHAILNKWLPLSDTVLRMVCEKLPCPSQMSEARAEKLMSSLSKPFELLPEATQQLKTAFVACSPSDDAPTIAFVSKMMVVDRHCLPKNKVRMLSSEDIALRRQQVREKLAQFTLKREQGDNVVVQEQQVKSGDVYEDGPIFLAFARVFSGTLKRGQELYVLGPKYDPGDIKNNSIEPNVTLKDLKAGQHVTRAKMGDLYVLMGRELECLESVPAGNVVGIGGLEEHILKSGTLSSSLACPSFTEFSQMVMPIVRVAVEPARPCEMPELIKGLKLLNQADPCVQVVLQESGEHVLVTAGEVHLQRCLQDLEECYAKIQINASQPIVPFRETIMAPLEPISTDNAGRVQIETPGKRLSMRLRAVSLPEEITNVLEKNVDVIKTMLQSQCPGHLEPTEEIKTSQKISLQWQSKVFKLHHQLNHAFGVNGWGDNAADRILSFGPRRCGPNVLLNYTPLTLPSPWNKNPTHAVFERTTLECLNSIINGFQLATLAGPICEEPLHGVAFIIEDIAIAVDQLAPLSHGEDGDNNNSGQHQQQCRSFSGQIMSAVKDGCRRSFTNQPQRLMAAMYNCSIQVSGEVVGKIYAILSRRHGKILEGDLEEGSASFSIAAVLPVVESFDLANEIRKQTSGLASHQLTFSHWEIIDIDPFWVPTTEEELELYGDKGDSINRAHVYMNSVRRRKGLAVSEKVVEFAEKQRTLSRKV
ncbi:elongation factor-like GTPase 1 [Daphnia carinata]|uniref:elongation factor-like GTPase 1 n=1 Tax=Daphnia carinata TaxID=120202 RepID=UPI00257A5E08|nr:elongation factor-like GTPase 1 [Daphnia carinata]